MLEDEWWLEADDEDYARVRGRLEGLRGPWERVQKAVLAYPHQPLPDLNPTPSLEEDVVALDQKGFVKFATEEDADGT